MRVVIADNSNLQHYLRPMCQICLLRKHDGSLGRPRVSPFFLNDSRLRDPLRYLSPRIPYVIPRSHVIPHACGRSMSRRKTVVGVTGISAHRCTAATVQRGDQRRDVAEIRRSDVVSGPEAFPPRSCRAVSPAWCKCIQMVFGKAGVAKHPGPAERCRDDGLGTFGVSNAVCRSVS